MNRIITPIILGIVYVIIFVNLFFSSHIFFYDSEDMLKLVIIITINFIDIMIAIIGKVIFNVENKKIISVPKVILNIFMLLTTIIWWREIKYDHLSQIALLSYLLVMLWIILRILLGIMEVIMIAFEKKIKNYTNGKNLNSIIKPVIQLVGYIILVIGVLNVNYLMLFIPIIMFVIDFIILITNKKKINIIKFIISFIITLATFGLYIFSSWILIFILLGAILQIILNIIEIIKISSFLRKNMKKILLIIFFSIIVVIIVIFGVNLYKIISFENEIKNAKESGKYIEINSYEERNHDIEVKVDEDIRLTIYRT